MHVKFILMSVCFVLVGPGSSAPPRWTLSVEQREQVTDFAQISTNYTLLQAMLLLLFST